MTPHRWSPAPVPVRREEDKVRGSGTAVIPQTLGDKLDESMRIRKHNSEEAARHMGVATSEVLLWKHDMQIPEPTHFEAVLDYLFVEERHLRGLILRSQMRRMQARIRT